MHSNSGNKFIGKEDTCCIPLLKVPGKKTVYPFIVRIPSYQIFGEETTLQFAFKISFFFFVLGFTQLCQEILL